MIRSVAEARERAVEALERRLSHLAPQAGIDNAFAASLLTVAHLIVVVLSPKKRIVYANPFFEEVTGYCLGEIEGKDWFEHFILPEDQERIQARFSRAVSGEPTRGELNAVRTKSGETRIVEWYDQTLRGGSEKALGLLAIGHDVTERERATRTELALRASHELLEAVFEKSMVCLAYLDADFNFVRVNESYARADHKRPEYYVGKNHFTLFPNDENRAIFERVRDTGTAYSVSAKPFEYAHDKERGVSHWDWTLTPIKSQTGMVIGLVLALHDVSERIEAIEAVQERENRISNELKQKEILLQEVHHRVKNNLQIVSSMLNLQAANCKDPEVAQLFAESNGRVQAMSLVHRVLYESNDMSKLDFSRYANELIAGLRVAFSGAEQRISLLADVEPIRLGLEQATPCGLIASELVTNAFKYAFPGRARGTIRIQMRSLPGSGLRLTVSDDGIGIPEEVVEHPSTLGLKMVRALTRQLGGELSLRTHPGTTFEVSFQPSSASTD